MESQKTYINKLPLEEAFQIVYQSTPICAFVNSSAIAVSFGTTTPIPIHIWNLSIM